MYTRPALYGTDLHEIVDIKREINRDLYEKGAGEFASSLKAKDLFKAFEAKEKVTMLYTESNRLIGYAVLVKPTKKQKSELFKEFPDRNVYVLLDIGILPGYQKKGATSELIDDLLDYAKKMNVNAIAGKVDPKNLPAIKTLTHISSQMWFVEGVGKVNFLLPLELE